MQDRSLYVVTGDDLDLTRLARKIVGPLRLVEVSELRRLPQLVGRRAWLLLSTRTAMANAEHCHQLRGSWRIVLLYEREFLLEASDWFGFVETWSEIGCFEKRALNILTLADAGYSLWPQDADVREGLLPLRRARVRTLSPFDREVLSELGHGATNRQIARTLRASDREVAESLRRSMKALHVDRRLQAALVSAREGDNR